MREPTGLDERLAAGRTELLSTIDQPPLARIGARAATLRRRRQGLMAGGAMAVVAVAALVAPLALRGGQGSPQVAEPPSGGPVHADSSIRIYTGAGITVNGLADLNGVTDLPGVFADVEFGDADHGYAITSCPPESRDCRPAFAATDDGGLTWGSRALPPGAGIDTVPALVPFPTGRVALDAGTYVYLSPDAGRHWDERTRPAGKHVAAAGSGEILRGSGSGCGGGPVEVWTPDRGPIGALAKQPDITVCWVAPAATADGAWWVGGFSGSQPALAVSRDGGRTWSRRVLAGTGTASVAVVGQHAYAVVTDDGSDGLVTIFHSVRGGPFTLVPAGASRPRVTGGLVPLLDGRLLVAGPPGRWYVSADDGTTFRDANGTLPAVGRFQRTAAGYVAYNLFNAGWAAFSTDGTTWRKFPLK